MTADGLAEKDVTLEIAGRLEALLLEAGFGVQLTRRDDHGMSLHDRVAAANRARGDIFVSIHVNSIPAPERRGVETYFLGATDDPQLERLARAENVASGYSLADFRLLFEGVLTDVRHDESRRLALTVQRKLFAGLHRDHPELVDRGVKQAPFVVLVGTAMPSVLAEVSCISNQDEAALLSGPGYREEIAGALAAGIRGYAARRAQSTVAGGRATEHPTMKKGGNTP